MYEDHEDILFWNESIAPTRVTLPLCVYARLWLRVVVLLAWTGEVRCLAGGVVVNRVSVLQCHLTLLSYTFSSSRSRRAGHPICLLCTAEWAAACVSDEPGPICLDTPALWFRHLLLYVNWQAGWLQCTPADRQNRWQETVWFTQMVPSFSKMRASFSPFLIPAAFTRPHYLTLGAKTKVPSPLGATVLFTLLVRT